MAHWDGGFFIEGGTLDYYIYEITGKAYSWGFGLFVNGNIPQQCMAWSWCCCFFLVSEFLLKAWSFEHQPLEASMSFVFVVQKKHDHISGS